MNKSILIAAVVAALGTSAFADVAFDTFSPGDTFNTGNGWTISGATGQIGQRIDQGDQFVSATTGNVSLITIAMGYVNGTNSATLHLFTDNAGVLGSEIGTFGISGMGTFGTAFAPSTVGAAGPLLTTGQSYWLIAESASDSWLAWNKNTSGVSGNHFFSVDGSDNYLGETAGAFRVETSPVPEPVSMIALSGGALALIRRRRSK